MAEFKVAEIFTSINGEGTKAGQTAVFVRFTGCNLNCSYCDTKWSNEPNAEYKLMTDREILSRIKETVIKNVTLTGGEPLLREGIHELLKEIAKDGFLQAEIETNGSISLKKICDLQKENVTFTMDYKLSCSGMEKSMCLDNFRILGKNDTVKFVVGCHDDLIKTKKIIDDYRLNGKCNLYISPVFGRIKLEDIVDFMKQNVMNNVNMQIQLHKVIWDPDKKGV